MPADRTSAVVNASVRTDSSAIAERSVASMLNYRVVVVVVVDTKKNQKNKGCARVVVRSTSLGFGHRGNREKEREKEREREKGERKGERDVRERES